MSVELASVVERRLGALPASAEFLRRLDVAGIIDELCPVRDVAAASVQGPCQLSTVGAGGDRVEPRVGEVVGACAAVLGAPLRRAGRQASLRGTTWSMSSWAAPLAVTPSYDETQFPDTARHWPSRSTSLAGCQKTFRERKALSPWRPVALLCRAAVLSRLGDVVRLAVVTRSALRLT